METSLPMQQITYWKEPDGKVRYSPSNKIMFDEFDEFMEKFIYEYT